MIAWKVIFRRNKWTRPHQSEEIVVVASEDNFQALFDALHLRYPEALVDSVERLGEAVVEEA